MALHYDIDAGAGCVRIAGAGPLSMTEMVAMVDTVAEDARFRPHYGVIFSLLNATYAADLPDGDIFADALKRRQKDFQGPFALVVPPGLHVLAQLFCVMARTGGFDRMRCFLDAAEAEDWCTHWKPTAAER